MTGRWGLLLGLAGLGFFLYSAFHPRHPGMTGPEGQLPNAESWQPLSQTLPPSGEIFQAISPRIRSMFRISVG